MWRSPQTNETVATNKCDGRHKQMKRSPHFGKTAATDRRLMQMPDSENTKANIFKFSFAFPYDLCNFAIVLL